MFDGVGVVEVDDLVVDGGFVVVYEGDGVVDGGLVVFLGEGG